MTEAMVKTTIRFRKSLHERVRIHAVKANTTIEAIVEAALADYLKKHEVSEVYVYRQETTKKPYKTAVIKS